MDSLRLRLILLSTLLSGLVMGALGAIAWHFTGKAFRESIDVQHRDRIGRIQRDLHPRIDLERFRSHLHIGFGQEIEEGYRLLRVMDHRNQRTIYAFPDNDWHLSLPEGFLPDEAGNPAATSDSNPTEEDRILSELLGEPLNPPGEFDRKGRPKKGDAFDRPPPGDRFLPKSQKGEKDKAGQKDGARPRGGEEVLFTDFFFDGRNWRVIHYSGRGYSVVSAIDRERAEAELERLRVLFLVSMPFGLCLIAGGGWIVANRALRPIRRISQSAERVTAKGLGERIPSSPLSDPEIHELIDVLNDMMGRLETSFRHANRFSADVSHELKTPIAILQAEIESALKETPEDISAHQNLLVVREEVQRLKSITASLFLLAQADVGQLVKNAETFDLSAELAELAEDAAILATEQGISLATTIESGLSLAGDPTLLRQAFLNLITNAIKYNRADGAIRLDFARPEEGGPCRFTIENTGHAIPVEDHDRIFDRFHRVDKARSRRVDGFGLGLSLAREIVEGHGGILRLVHSRDDSTRFEVELPLP